MTYAEKLRNPLWQKNRLKILERDGFTCLYCGDKDTELQIHHTYYDKDKEPWEYPEESLQTTCKHCHKIITSIKTYATYIKGAKYNLKGEGEYQMYCLVTSHKYGDRHSLFIVSICDDEMNIISGIMEEDFNDISRLIEISKSTKKEQKNVERGILFPA